MPYNRNIYTIDLEKLAHWVVPHRWRFPVTLVWVKSMTVNFTDLYNRFLLYRKRKKYDLYITPQICFLEKALNDKYDYLQRRIYIQDGNDRDPIHLYRREELKPVYLFKRSEDKPVYLRRRIETAEFGVDFTVNVPSDILFDPAEMRTYLTGYKLTTKTFEIVTF